ncbi:ATP-binding cassette domain-containing protein [Candidatus Poribacteria bacterium]|nr:ATP-binding cassette domain-containing protein [Candidatus Poribacteria bacterium]MYH79381.1 ATP-binding cassette domain-containing protein [Candidatus Poribacteria bacterium]MYK93871.1 ATP-binding cassette domain-containing protein [Candidatus Poribacteria bacterium]
MTAVLLQMQAIIKDFPGVRALDDASFEVRSGEIHALCGENGAGKSTLIKILGGVYPYGTYSGSMRINDSEQQFHSVRDAERAGIAIIHQELALIPEMTVAENIYLGKEPRRFGVIDRHRLYHEAGELLSQFGLAIPLEKPVYELGIGQQQLVEIAKALGRSLRSGNALLLVLDEPTAALTESEVDILRQILTRLREKGVACIYITHKLKEIFQIADRVTVLRDGKTVATQSIKSPECTEDVLISQMVGRELTTLFPERQASANIGNGSKEEGVALRVENLSTYPSEPPRLENVSFEVRRGEILGIAGLMGAGRTELISTIFGGYDGKWMGEIIIEGTPVQIHAPCEAIQQGMALVSEDRKRYGLLLDADVTCNMTLVNLGLSADLTSYGVINHNAASEKSEHYVNSLQIKTPSLEVPVNQLSGGNQQKVVLGKWLMTHPKVLFLDEPTRGIDVGAKAEIHALMAKLADAGVAIVFVSSELPEILGMSDRVLVLHEGKITGEFTNDNLTQEEILRCAAGA